MTERAASGSTFPLGLTTVTCTATDAAGNSSSKTFSVTVYDPTPPVITPSVTGTLGNNGWYVSNVSVSWTVIDPESPVTSRVGCDPITVTADTPGATMTCTATSAGGTASQSVTIKIDKTPPVITGLPTAACTLWPSNHKLVRVATVTANGGLSGLGTLVVTGTSSEPENGLGDGDAAPDIVISGGVVELRAERSGTGTGRVYTLTATATDGAGNASVATATCTVPRDQRK